MSRQHSQSRENINFPEDELEGRSKGGIEEIGGSSSPGKMHPHQTHIHASLKMAFACQIYHTAPIARPKPTALCSKVWLHHRYILG